MVILLCYEDVNEINEKYTVNGVIKIKLHKY